jgi:hypothetical protein
MMCDKLAKLKRHQSYYHDKAWEKIVVFWLMKKKRNTVPAKYYAKLSEGCFFTNIPFIRDPIKTFCDTYPLQEIEVQKIEGKNTIRYPSTSHPHLWHINNLYSDFPDAQDEEERTEVITAIIAAEKAHLLEVIEFVKEFNICVSDQNTHANSCETCKKLAGV